MKKQTLYLSKPLTLNGNEIENINFKCKNITILNLNVNIENYEKIMKYFNDNNIFYREVIEGFISDNNFENNNFGDNFENNNFDDSEIVENTNLTDEERILNLLKKVKQFNPNNNLDNLCYNKNNIPKIKKIVDITIPKGIYLTTEDEIVFISKIFNTSGSWYKQHEIIYYAEKDCYLDPFKLYCKHMTKCKKEDRKNCLCGILQNHKKDFEVYKHYLLNDDVIF